MESLRTEVEGIGAAYFFEHSEINPLGEDADRVKSLAELRNLALEPLRQYPKDYAPDTTAIFLNDVALCMEDILELIHQRRYQHADMVCGMDWIYLSPNPTFYDVWIARDMSGNSFFNIPPDGNWDSAWDLFSNNDATKWRYRAYKPFQVFSCWNGIAVFTATPILEDGIRFRSAGVGECYPGEPILFCRDLWGLGYGRIAVVPSVGVAYEEGRAREVKELRGYVADVVEDEGEGDLIVWEGRPPELVKCFWSYANQQWLPWNESLVVV